MFVTCDEEDNYGWSGNNVILVHVLSHEVCKLDRPGKDVTYDIQQKHVEYQHSYMLYEKRILTFVHIPSLSVPINSEDPHGHWSSER